ncbi:hypothetical protein [Candidatus Poriferisodalis sp.]|uniref:hypothetical protein n=1 Tax=Candidatus Poriferisodalis sp. TaxID=3101277 RepID=UPI003AF83C49
MPVIERTFSDFLRHPNEVVAELDEHDVVLRRRNAPALRLCRADRDVARSEPFDALARLLRNLAMHSPGSISAALSDAYPWVAYLPCEECELFAEELTQELLAAASVGNYAPVAQLVREWQSTAEVYADPELLRRLSEPIEVTHGGPVPYPTG